jgi:hypothetical protein
VTPCSADWQSAAEWHSAFLRRARPRKRRIANPPQDAILHYMAFNCGFGRRRRRSCK